MNNFSQNGCDEDRSKHATGDFIEETSKTNVLFNASLRGNENEIPESFGDHTQHTKKNRKKSNHSTTDSPDDQYFVSLPLLKQRLGSMFERKKYTDVLFVVGPTEEIVEAHRTILASASLTFQQLLYESKSLFSDTHDKFLVREPDYSVDSIQVFIKGIYTNEIPICLNLSTSLEVYNLTEKYSVQFLQDQIINHIQNSVTVSNVFEALKVSTSTIRLTCMIPMCWRIIEEHTSAVLEYHLDTLDQSSFVRLLERDQLNLEEVELFQFMVKWAAGQCKRRGCKTTGRNKRQMLEPLLKYIRFSNMGLSSFNDVVLPSRILEPKEIHDIVTHLSKHPESESKTKISSSTNANATTQKINGKSHRVGKIRSAMELTKGNLNVSHHSESAIGTTTKTKIRPRKNGKIRG